MTITQIISTPIEELVTLPGWQRRSILSTVREKHLDAIAILFHLPDSSINREISRSLQEDIAILSAIESKLSQTAG